MAGTSGCTRQLKQLTLSDPSCAMDGASESDYLTAPATEAELATTSSSFLSGRSESMMEGSESRECSSTIEEQIEHSQSHWSLLADLPDTFEEGEEEVAEVDNVKVFKSLQTHPTWGSFFATFGYDFGTYESAGGGQAELYEAQVTWWNPKYNERDLKRGTEWVVKVFKKGTFLRHLHFELPHGLLQFYAQQLENWNSSTPKVFPRYYCQGLRGRLLKDGRFAFLLTKEHMGLRNLIEHNMKLRNGEDCGLFLKEESEYIMYCIALRVHWLHNYNIVHRVIKASNVLMKEVDSHY